MNEVPPIHDVPPILPPSYRDRRTSLILFGILEILLGALCLLMAGVAFWIGWSWYRLKVEGW